MADTHITSHPSEAAPAEASHEEASHGDVKFEHTDANARDVFVAGLVLGAVVVVASLVVVGFYFVLLAQDNPSKVSTLPPAAGDTRDNPARMPPEPRLEAIEDLREPSDTRFQFQPHRAPGSLSEQEKEKIQKAIQEIQLPAQKKDPPPSFSRRLYSKASAGRVETGGQ
jgi:hypothetical protein